MFNDLELDFLIFADRAEILNGKLYMMGGAWNQFNLLIPNAYISFTVVLGIIVPWHLTERVHNIILKIEDDDGNPVHEDCNLTLNVRKTPDAIEGQSFRTTAVLTTGFQVPKFGTYCVTAMSGNQSKRSTFYVVDQRKHFQNLQKPQ